ncbi:MAG: KUP/HAK/KT family potassium transporter [Nannocystaceae bacterium]
MSDAPQAPAASPEHAAAAEPAHPHAAESGRHPRGHGRAMLVGALGVVFGDIGTSPLYAFHESIHHGGGGSEEAVLGVLSLFFWSLVIVVAIKYVIFISRADNDGEGGILALLALVPPRPRRSPVHIGVTAALVILGTSLLYGDGVITPAISVLSAIEGLRIVSDDPSWHARVDTWVVPITCAILVGLFAVQRSGTARVGRAFGPVMIVWFAVLALVGLWHVARAPMVLQAALPHHAWHVLVHGKAEALPVLGAVVLCVTGSEALYADMGHFGRGPIRNGWFWIVMPALLLNYFGQGALVLREPGVGHSFWGMVPAGAPTLALVAIATAATVIASQALITGCYSLTRQAVQLGYFPRVRIVHTSRTTEGQIYVPSINWALAVACLVLVVSFGSASQLAAAYGIAVTGTMLVTSVVFFVVITRSWGWSYARAVPLLLLFASVDGVFLGANLVKLGEGGWVPLAIGLVLFTLMVTWKQGRALVAAHMASATLPLSAVAESAQDAGRRVPGTGVFMTPDARATPLALLHHFKHAKVLPQTVIALSVHIETMPWVPKRNRAAVEALPGGFWRVQLRFGFMQTPTVPASLLLACEAHGIPIDANDVSYFVGREHFLPTGPGKMARWRKILFEVLSRNVAPATDAFGIPPGRVVELGSQVPL